MKSQKQTPAPLRWPKALAIQLAVALIAAAATALCQGLGPVVGALTLWVMMPLAGAWSAFRAVRRGLLNYAAWLPPPVCLYLANLAIWGYAPPAGAALVCALVSLVGAAAGEVYNQTKHRK